MRFFIKEHAQILDRGYFIIMSDSTVCNLDICMMHIFFVDAVIVDINFSIAIHIPSG
jgi:hypothetical protein